MGLDRIDIGLAMRRLAERRIEDAMREGKFDNLPGAGKPIDLEPMPADENARLTWWALRILRQNDFVPDEVRLRKRIELLKAALPRIREERQLETAVMEVNALVRQLNTLGTNALRGDVVPLDLAIERARLRERITP